MTFVVLRPSITKHTGEYLGDKIRVGFPVIAKKRNCLLYFGKDVCLKFGLKQGERYVLHMDESVPFRVRLVKDETGWKLGKQGDNLKIQLVWNTKIPEGYDKAMRFATYTLVEGVLEISLPKANLEASEG